MMSLDLFNGFFSRHYEKSQLITIALQCLQMNL